MFMDGKEERALCIEGLVVATKAAQGAGMVKEALDTLANWFYTRGRMFLGGC